MKEVPGYEGILAATEKGEIYRLNYRNTGKSRKLSVQIKKDNICTINVRIDKKIHTLSVHRLVGLAFLPNPNNLPCINHKDENRLNNEVSNLEWCSYEYNNNYMTRNRRISLSNTNGKKSKKVIQYDLKGNFIKEWPSTHEIQRVLGYKQANISSCARRDKSHKTAYGFLWRYKD